MCFSATASFTASAFLAGVGAATLAQKPAPREAAFAAIPLIFAAHQAIEGVIWLKLGAGSDAPQPLVIAYLLIAQVLWPAFIPASVIMMETNRRRWGLWVLLAAGLFVSGALAMVLIRHPYSVSAVADGLRYATDHRFEERLLGLYLVTTTAPCSCRATAMSLLSARRRCSDRSSPWSRFIWRRRRSGAFFRRWRASSSSCTSGARGG
ncbi:MAG: DUF6629 family protein [Parvularculaceae bacterium]